MQGKYGNLLLAGMLAGLLPLLAVADGLSEKIFERKMRQAEKGNVEAQYVVAERYTSGKGVERDLEKAFHWFLKAADTGDAKAQLRVAEYLEAGRGTEQNLEQAYVWYARAAEQGLATAKEKLAARERAVHEAELAAKRKARTEQERAEREARERVAKEKAAHGKAAHAARVRAEQEHMEREALERAERAERARVERERALTVPKLADALRAGGWAASGTQVEFLPSERTSCIRQGASRIVCFTGERNVNVGDSHVRYQAKSKIDLRAGGSFGIRYRYQVIKLRRFDSSLPTHDQPTTPRLEVGWQEPAYKLHCQMVNPATLSCTDEKGHLMSFNR